ncbi:PREDICTED: uncharacterized protein LOC104592181 [Nelumbo nucifera]|uniref:Uncharacterized protein LOC104592180 n=2 Tax=Nelumbo nucifera TaxID=4432 RepID=A0A1U7ZEC5_NELNU|nr:PREDICTED: uncharacterized protein LOC104592180 [Nelumbo nucifera]XP_010249706.1 PREDICTED: uncharacterized protein LOC104592181 [Nelumbo nucifera]DAD44650.1 TPA_asm: hypothetical protein HUJ06_002880 [Nelumbo nucifera]
MEMGPEKSKPLHNFSMPRLKWGNQKLLRCMKVDSKGEISSVERRFSAAAGQSGASIIRGRESRSLKRRFSNGFENSRKSPLPPPIGNSVEKSKIDKDGDDGIEAIREKLELHLRTAADKLNVTIPEVREENEASAAARPWNLRTRRAACKAPTETTAGRGGGGSSINEERQQNSSPFRNGNSTMKSNRLQGVTTVQVVEKDKKERPKFSISLSRYEVEEDFLAMTGTRPPRRPKKRPRIIQKQQDAIFPGLWLTEITPDTYKVPDLPEPGKRSR